MSPIGLRFLSRFLFDTPLNGFRTLCQPHGYSIRKALASFQLSQQNIPLITSNTYFNIQPQARTASMRSQPSRNSIATPWH